MLAKPMFARGPPLPSAPCVKQAGPNVTFTLVTTLRVLCAPNVGSNVSHIVYSGTLCGGRGSKYILWQSMHTIDPHTGKEPAQCSWNRSADPGDVRNYLGRCGVAPLAVLIPTQVC